MGYSTDFNGTFDIKPYLGLAQVDYLQAFSRTRRQARVPGAVDSLPDRKRKAVGIPAGTYGDFYVGDEATRGQAWLLDASILSANNPPGAHIRQRVFRLPDGNGDPTVPCEGAGAHLEHGDHGCVGVTLDVDLGYPIPADKQPGLWCQWTPTDDGRELEWDQGEKFYYYVEWLEYLIRKFFKPWKRELNGEVAFQGEMMEDRGVIVVRKNAVKLLYLDQLLTAANIDAAFERETE